jgi:hypothetical protein
VGELLLRHAEALTKAANEIPCVVRHRILTSLRCLGGSHLFATGRPLWQQCAYQCARQGFRYDPCAWTRSKRRNHARGG